MTRDLQRFLRPRSIAVFGGHWARNVIEQCRRMKFDGEIWPVHPERNESCGLRCYRSTADLPDSPDAAFVGVNRRSTIGVVRDLAERGAGGAVCFASGFSEAAAEDSDGEVLQHTLLSAAGAMPVLGPNCYGLINYLDGALLWPDQHGGQRETRGVAILTQSSNIAINMTMQRRALPIAYVVTAGNQAQFGLAELGAALLEDERVTALGFYIEGFGDPRRFEVLAARARALRKPVVALKAGQSSQARAAIVSHSNSLAGESAGAKAFLERLGVAQVNSVPELLEALKLLHVAGPLPGRRIASMSCSGGEAAVVADAAERRSLEFSTLVESQRIGLRKALGPLVALSNPLDFHTFIWADLPAMTATFRAMMQDGADITFLILDFPRADRCDATAWFPAVDALIAARDATGRVAAVVATLPENFPEDLALSLAARGITPLFGIDEALAAAEAGATCGENLSGKAPAPLLIAPVFEGAIRLVSEADAKAMLARIGLGIPRGRTASTPEAAAEAATEIGFPIVLKGTGVAHKTDRNAVRLGLLTPEQTRAVAEEMACLVEGYLVEEFVGDVVAELLVGIVRDPTGGFVLTVGAGGVLTELMHDSVSMLLPATREEIHRSLGRLRLAPVLQGYRGRPGVNFARVVAAIAALCTFAEANAPRLDEIEVNPLLCRAGDAIVADALIRLREVSP